MEKSSHPISTVGSNPISTVGSTAAPTTFVQADAHTFRDLVQKLTGATDDTVEKLPVTVPARYSARSPSCGGSGDVGGPRGPAFKLHERRHSMRKLEIKLGLTSLRGGVLSPRSQPLISPISSPVTPLGSDPLFSGQFSASSSDSPMSSPAVSEEEKAIAGKGFYLHPSPLSTPRGSEPPELLPLFPLHSPRQSE
ncbi:hypothetical protein AAC387_Pa03g0276 [Persea americana]